MSSLLYNFCKDRSWTKAMIRVNILGSVEASNDIHATDSYGRTTFSCAVAWGAPPDLVQRMLDISKVDTDKLDTAKNIVTVTDTVSWLPLHNAAAFNPHIEVSELLIGEHPLGLLADATDEDDISGRITENTPLQLCNRYQGRDFAHEAVKGLLCSSTEAVMQADYPTLAALVFHNRMERLCRPELLTKQHHPSYNLCGVTLEPHE
jgi:hypothetical protein